MIFLLYICHFLLKKALETSIPFVGIITLKQGKKGEYSCVYRSDKVRMNVWSHWFSKLATQKVYLKLNQKVVVLITLSTHGKPAHRTELNKSHNHPLIAL